MIVEIDVLLARKQNVMVQHVVIFGETLSSKRGLLSQASFSVCEADWKSAISPLQFSADLSLDSVLRSNLCPFSFLTLLS